MQQSFLQEHPEGTLLCLTVQLPGEVKRSAESLVVAESAVEAIREMFPKRSFELLRDLETGFEGYFVVPLEPMDAKRAAIGIEDEHPLGRLMDIDVILADGPIPRSAVGAPERRCLICSQPARICMRARTHTTAELLAAVSAMVSL